MGGVNPAYLLKTKRVDYFYVQANIDRGVVWSLLKAKPEGLKLARIGNWHINLVGMNVGEAESTDWHKINRFEDALFHLAHS